MPAGTRKPLDTDYILVLSHTQVRFNCLFHALLVPDNSSTTIFPRTICPMTKNAAYIRLAGVTRQPRIRRPYCPYTCFYYCRQTVHAPDYIQTYKTKDIGYDASAVRSSRLIPKTMHGACDTLRYAACDPMKIRCSAGYMDFRTTCLLSIHAT